MDYAPPPLPVPSQRNQGCSPLAKLGCGCGVLVLFLAAGVIALIYPHMPAMQEFTATYQKAPAAAAGKLIADFLPDVEFVSADETAQIITFRNKKTGKTVPVSIQDIKAGKMPSALEEGGKEPPGKP